MVLWITLGLALLAALLIGPAPVLLARARWPLRAPRAALVLWQALGATATLSAVGAGLGAAVAPLATTLTHGVHTLLAQLLAGQLPSGLRWPHYLALTWAVGLVGFLVWRCGHAIRLTFGKRRRHRDVVDVIAEPVTELGPDVGMLDHPAPTAYCLPGRPSRIVISLGAVNLLPRSELRALLAHERAHASARHDLAVLPFTALAHALSGLTTVRLARDAVCLLVEMLADDSARRAHDDRILARALLHLAAHKSTAPPEAFAATGAPVLTRVHRLLEPVPPISAWQRLLVYGLALALLFVPLGVLFSPLCPVLP